MNPTERAPAEDDGTDPGGHDQPDVSQPPPGPADPTPQDDLGDAEDGWQPV